MAGRNWSRTDLAGGMIFVTVGVVFGTSTLLNLKLGTAFRMGPGFFPLMLCGLLIVFGVAIAIRGTLTAQVPIGVWPWRGILVITLAQLVFSFSVYGLGLVLSLPLLILIAAFASRKTSLLPAILLAAGLTVFSIIVFRYGFGLTVPLFGRWIAS